MQRPLLIVAVLYAAGILVGDFIPVPLHWLVVAACCGGLMAMFWRRARSIFLPIFLILLGWTSMIWHTAVLSSDDLRAIVGAKPEYVSVRGKLKVAPAEHIFERHSEEMERTVAYVDVSALARGTNWQHATGELIVMTPGVLAENFYAGQNVEVAGVIMPPNGPLADGLFDSKSFLRRKGIYFQLRATSTNDWQICGTPAPRPLSSRFFSYAKRTLALGLPREDLPLRLIWTLVLDWKAPMTASVEEPFVKAGTLVDFAIHTMDSIPCEGCIFLHSV